MNVLLVWEAIPEEICFYKLENVSDEDIEILDGANAKYINTSDETDSVSKISNFICSRDDYCEVEGAEGNCKWGGCKIEYGEGKCVTDFKFDRVYSCGFLV